MRSKRKQTIKIKTNCFVYSFLLHSSKMVVLNFPFTFKIFFPHFSPSFFLSMANPYKGKSINQFGNWVSMVDPYKGKPICKPGKKRKGKQLFGITPLDIFVNMLDMKAKKREKYAFVPKTAEHDKILSIMKDAGFIQFYWEPTGVFTYTAVNLKYIGHAKVGALRNIRRVSKSSKPVYLNVEELSRREKRFNFSILRTDRGLISGREALVDNIGGELIIEINVAEE